MLRTLDSGPFGDTVRRGSLTAQMVKVARSIKSLKLCTMVVVQQRIIFLRLYGLKSVRLGNDLLFFCLGLIAMLRGTYYDMQQ